MAKKQKKKKRNKTKPDNEHSPSLTARYNVVIEKGRELVGKYEQRGRGDNWRIYNYYARPDIQRAMFEYSKNRKITVLRHFRPLYSGVEKPEHILYIALYHAEHNRAWPSLHGQISRKLEGGLYLCDFVVEIDYKKDWETCFRATRPIIEMLRDFGVHACVKFSGHCSAHVILPGEIFPPEKGSQKRVRSELMQFVSGVVKQAQKLDRSFTNPGHFLRLAYSINESTGLVSLPIRLEEFDNFFWQDAKIENVKVVEDWWGVVPVDAQERMGKFLKFALHQKSFTAKKREAAKQFRKVAVKPKAEPQQQMVALQQLAQPLTDHQLYDHILESAKEALNWYETHRSEPRFMDAIEQLKQQDEHQAVMSLREHALKYEIELNDLWLAWRWELRKPDLEYYARADIQEAMYNTAQRRRVQVGSDGPFVKLQSPEDIYWLAIFLHSRLGRNEHPAFYCSTAKYDADDRFMVDYDIVLETDGRGSRQKSAELMESVLTVLQQLGVTFTLQFTGSVNMQAIISSAVKTVEPDGDPMLPPQQSTIVESIGKQLANTLREPEWVKILKHDDLILLMYSLNEFTGEPCVPIKIQKA